MSDIPTTIALLAVVATMLVAGAVRRWLFGWTSVQSASMVPTLRPGQLRVTLRARRIGRLQRGDIVVFGSPEVGQDLIKRIVGLPGDIVHVQGGGLVTVNGAPLAEPYVAVPGGPGGRFHVPPGTVLVLGDNRRISHDSRSWRHPFVPESALRGRLPRGAARARRSAAA